MAKTYEKNAGHDEVRRMRYPKYLGFTLVELIVVITILAILATIGFLALSGYSQDAKDSAIKANVRSLQTAIASEAAVTNNSPRYYVVHDSDYALSGAFAYVDGVSVALTGWDVGSAPADSNYTAGKPDYKKLKLNPDKFRISSSGLPGGALGALARASGFGASGFGASGFGADSAEASYDPSSLMAAGADFTVAGANGKKRIVSYVQSAGISPATKLASVMGNFPATWMPAGNVSWLLRAEPGSLTNLTGALVDGNASSGQSATAPTDAHAAGVVSLAHFDGRPDNGDPYRNYVTISVRGNDTSSVADETGKAFTSAGNVQISSTNGVANGDSNLLFDGTGDYATTPYVPAAMDWWTSDYTIEAWVYPVTLSTWGYVDGSERPSAMGLGNTATVSNYWSFWPISTGAVQFYYWNGARNWVNSTQTVTANQWNHIAMTKTSAGIQIWVNGVGGTVTAISGTPTSGTEIPFVIGQMNNRSVNGRIDDFRITKGVARYSSNFTPAQTPAVSGSAFADQKGLAISQGGEASVSYASPKFVGSAIFDGAGDYLSWASNADFGFGTGDFTIEFFAKTNLSKYQTVVDMRPAETNGAYPYLGIGTNGNVTYYVSSVTRINAGAWAMTANSWTHVALSRVSGTTRLYVDGVEKGSWTDSTNYLTAPLRLGRSAFASATAEDFAGQIDEFRVTKGIGRYSSNFAVPASAYPNP